MIAMTIQRETPMLKKWRRCLKAAALPCLAFWVGFGITCWVAL